MLSNENFCHARVIIQNRNPSSCGVTHALDVTRETATSLFSPFVAHDPKNPSYFDRTPVINLIIFNSSNFFFHLASNFYNYKVLISSKLDHFMMKYIQY
jgi:hypothetical protein